MALESMWSLINFLQMVLYIPLLNIFIPPLFLKFIQEFLSLAQFKFNFIGIPKAAFGSTGPLNSRFEENHIEDLLFINNFGITLFFWLGLFMFYLVIKILDLIFPQNRMKFIHRWKNEYEFNAVLRIFLECFLELITLALLDIFYVNIYFIYIYIYLE